MKSIVLSLMLLAAPIAAAQDPVIVAGQGFNFTLELVDTSGNFEIYHLPQFFEGTISIPEIGAHEIPVEIVALLPDYSRQFMIRPIEAADLTTFSTLVIGTDSFDQKTVDVYYLDRFPMRRHVDYSVLGLTGQ